MLVKQTAIYFIANAFSAAFGFLNVIAFTRIFALEAFGDYLLGLGFATLYATILSSSLKFTILRDQSRGDGTDVRPTILGALLLCGLTAPLGYLTARWINFAPAFAGASVALGLSIVVFDTSQELLRAQQMAASFMRGTMARAILVSVMGIGCVLIVKSGAALLASSSLAYLLATAGFWSSAWKRSTPSFDAAPLWRLIKRGFPLTLSGSLLGLATLQDRFLLANLAGSAAAGDFGASLDLVRQALIIPAISVASAFVPMTVKIFATQGVEDAQKHLEKCFELLLAIILPACVGLALVSTPVADLVLGPDLRQTAHMAMPVLCISVVFQILTQQYLHISFLLSNRNAFYFVNTASILAFNIIVVFLLVSRYGVMGAVWARLASDVFGFANALLLNRYAFPMPFPAGRAARVVLAVVGMALVVRTLSLKAALLGTLGLFLLIAAGVCVYGILAIAFDIAGSRAALPRLVQQMLNRRNAAPIFKSASSDQHGPQPFWRSLWRSLKA